MKLIGVVIIYIHVILYVSAFNSTQSNSPSEHNPIEYPDVIIESILHHLGTKELQPVNITQITTTLGYSQHSLQVASEILKGQHTYVAIENVLALRSTIDVTFDAVNRLITSLESSLISNACLADFGLLNVQNALQVVMDVCISTNWREGVVPINDVQTISKETVSSSIYGLSSATKTFITSASNFAQMTYASHDLVDNNLLIGVQAIVETVLNLIEIVVGGLKKMKDQERVFEHPSLINFQFTLGQLTSYQFNLIDGIADGITSSFTMILNETQSSIGTVEPTKSLESASRDLSNSVHSTYKNSVFDAYTFDTSSQNLIATISHLSYSIAILPSNLLLIREFHDMYEPEFQANLLYIDSIIRTLNDEITLIIQRQLIDIICTSSLMNESNLKNRLMELELSIQSIYSIIKSISAPRLRKHHFMSLSDQTITFF